MSTELDESELYQTQLQESTDDEEEPELVPVRKNTRKKSKSLSSSDDEEPELVPRKKSLSSSDDEEPELVPRKKTKSRRLTTETMAEKEKEKEKTRKSPTKKKSKSSSSSSSEIIQLRQQSSASASASASVTRSSQIHAETMLKRKNAKKLSTLIKRIEKRERSTLTQVLNDVRLYNMYMKKITVPQSLNWQRIVHRDSMFQMELDYHNFKINKDCISFKTKNTNTLYIDSYYFDNEIETCCYLSHSDFFDFLKNFASHLGYVQLELQDGSHKQMGKCKIPSYIYSLAGKQTFYERFHFKNESYTSKVERMQKKTMQEVFNSVDAAYKNMTLAEAAQIILKECIRQKEMDEEPYKDEDIEDENFADDTVELGWALDLLSIMRHLEYKFLPAERRFSFDL